MRIEQSYPTPIFGISTLAPRNRPNGFASKQINFRSDPVNKLTRRPSSLYRSYITTVTDNNLVDYHSYYRDGKEIGFIIDKSTGAVHCTVDDVFINTVFLNTYNGLDLGLFTIEDDTYVLNRDMVVKQLPDTDAALVQKVSHINITSALNYGESIVVNVTLSTGVREQVTYTVPDLGITKPDYDTADKARATRQVAIELATLLTAKTGITAHSLGSTVAIWETAGTDWLQVEIESGQGDRSTVAFNQITESTDGLPLFAVVGTRITVRPDPTSEKGIYYLQAERVADTPTGEELEEVVWAETRSPSDPHSLDNTTLPHKISYDGNTFTFGQVNWDSRRAGNNDSTPFPSFVGETLETMGYFQKRLVVTSGNSVYMTETDDLGNWFRQSAVQLLVTDPIEVTTSELGTDKIMHLVPHNKDLLCIASNAQFKIQGSTAITPETVSMPLTTKYECQESVAPVTIGNSVFFPIDYGDSTGIQEYTGERETSQDFATPITNHIIGYLKGKAKLFAASPNLEMLALVTDDIVDNRIFIYEQYTEGDGKRSQSAWSEWLFPEDNKILDIKFRRNELILLMAVGTKVFVKAIPMYTRVTTSPLEVYLDDLYEIETDGTKAILPTEYSTAGAIAVRGKGTKYELWEVGFTREGNVVTFEEDIGAGTVYFGKTYRSTYEPTRPFRYDSDGSTITTDRIRIGRWIISLVDTYELTMVKKSNFYEDTEIKFDSRFVGRYRLGDLDTYTGDWKFSFGEQASLAVAEFYADSYLGCTISDISWEGQYFQSKQRM